MKRFTLIIFCAFLLNPIISKGAFLLLLHEKMRIERMYGDDGISHTDSINAYNGNDKSMWRYGSWCIRNNRKEIGIKMIKQSASS
ncbi:MAG: hypothetical protein NC453_21250, partial [Muribaculum sp.]|nr:hypothetical protein [Muribaculum sp.]